jgi:hypothetical protein
MGGMWWFWVLLVGFGFWLWGFGSRFYPRREYRSRQDPLELARRRLTGGQISVEEFEKIRAALSDR